MKKLFPIGVIFVITFIFFWQFFIKGLLPIPADTIVGLYYPFRDIYAKTNPNGVPFKNFLITDPVRQQYPWRNLSIDIEKTGNLPVWNPYNFAGTPLMQNSQSAVFYPLNILFFLMPFSISWSLLIFLGPLLAGIFMYFYLNNLKLNKISSILGAISFSFCGFSVAWMEWGTVLHTALWIPLILLSIDNIFTGFQENLKFKIQNLKLQLKIKDHLVWGFIFTFSLISSFLAGHLQIFFYLFILSFAYLLCRWWQSNKKRKTIFLFSIFYFLFLILTSVQWLPTLKFILLSARSVDIENINTLGWFIPWQNIIQFIVPDFFGNPTTLNYWGVWNYGEFSSYVGILPLLMAFFALFFRKDKKTLFFGLAFFTSLIFALPTFIAEIPFKLHIPFLSTSQPTRLLFITDFSLAVLAGFGLDYFIKSKNRKNIFYILGIFFLIFSALWLIVIFLRGNLVPLENLKVSKNNLIFPSVIFILVCILLLVIIFYPKNKFTKNFQIVTLYLLIVITAIELFRFGWKFEPFTKKEYLFPETKITAFLQNQKQPFRVLSTDSRILPPNFSIMYKIQTLDGYDPLYLQRHGALMVASSRGAPDISPPFGFNRIITPQDPLSRINDFLGVKYVLSLEEQKNKKLNLVFTDGSVKIYENTTVLPRAFFVKNTLLVSSNKEAIDALFDLSYPLNERAVIENALSDKDLFQASWDLGKADIVSYQENKVVIKTKTSGRGFLVFTDSYYPTWHATIDGSKTKIYLTDYNFRGIIVPNGEHTIEFNISLF